MKPITLPLKSRRSWRAPLIGVAVLALAGGGWTVMKTQSKAAVQQAAPAAGKPAKEPVYELAGADVTAIESRALAMSLPLSGSLMPVAQATIRSKVGGEVHESGVREGTTVQAGQVLVRLDQADLKARLQQQQAMLDEAQAKLELARKNEGNARALLGQKYISQNSYDSTSNSVDLAKAAVKSASAMVEIARIALNDSVIRAPISGIVSKRHVQAGDKVAPDMPVYTIVSLNELTLEAQVPTTEIPRVKVGQEVRFKVDGFAGRQFGGKVARISPTTEMGSRAMLVYISVANADGALRGGMFAKGSITTQQSQEAPVVPVAALREENGKQLVYQIVDGKVVAQPVTIGLRNEDEGYVQVTEGVARGAHIIIARLEGVKPGAKVKLATPAANTAQSKPAAPVRG
jgi:RND family efflux transporter MFP subunit